MPMPVFELVLRAGVVVVVFAFFSVIKYGRAGVDVDDAGVDVDDEKKMKRNVKVMSATIGNFNNLRK